MKVSLKWLKDYVEIPSDLKLSQLVHDLTMSTVEVEGTTVLSEKFDKMIIGVIKEVLPHPNADRLKICRTDIGNGDIREIVCGGINVANDMKVAVALPGSIVRWHGEGEPIELTVAKVRGVESYGMICASTEIYLADLFPLIDEEGITDLSSFDAPAGTPLAIALGIDDVILEIDNKSLTNRPDLWGHYGIAREISAIYNLPFKEMASFSVPSVPNLGIKIKNESLCPRYMGIKIEGLSVIPAPFEMQKRIWSVGMRPINAIVDITNYVMLSTGQPTHAFDSDNIVGHISVRTAKPEEKLLLLNGEELTLSNEDLVIVDDAGPVGLAGVMGGEKDSVLPKTDKVILEIANFTPIEIRRTATRYETRTEAAIRYEKGIDPERCELAISLAMQKFAEIFPNMSITGFEDIYSKPLEEKKIDVSLNWLEKRLGKKIPTDEINDILKRLGFNVVFNEDTMNVIVPSWRATGDVSISNDILEEVARIYGFDNFEAVPITTTIDGAINQQDVDIDRKIREYLAFRCGMQEVYTYPWVHEEYIKAILSNTDEMLSISTPPSPEERFIRSSHIPNLCKSVAENLRFINEFAIFESAQVYCNREFKTVYDSKESLPLERKKIAGAFVGDSKHLNSLFRKVKGILESLPRYVHMEAFTFEKIEKPIWADDIVWLNIKQNNVYIGDMALLSKKAALECGIKNSLVVIFEIDIDSLKLFSSRTNKFLSIPEYPIIDYDLSLLVDLSVKWKDIVDVIMSNKKDILRDVSFVGDYRGQQVPDNKKSITLRLVIGSLEKTLTSNEIENYVNAIVKEMKKKLGAKLR